MTSDVVTDPLEVLGLLTLGALRKLLLSWQFYLLHLLLKTPFMNE